MYLVLALMGFHTCVTGRQISALQRSTNVLCKDAKYKMFQTFILSQNHTKDFSRLSNEDDESPRVLVEYYRPKQAPNLLFGQNLPS